MSSAKTERLLTLLNVLLDTEAPLSAAELRRRVGGYAEGDVAFRRTFERDKADLAEMLGRPLRPEPIPGSDPPLDGYRLRPDETYLRDPGLTAEERTALAVAASAIRLGGIDPAQGALKVGVAPHPASTGLGTEIPADSTVVTLFQAVAEQREVTFSYRGEPRRVQPQQLRFTRGRWYLTADDLARGAERLFRVDRFDGPAEAGPPRRFAARAVEPDDPWSEPWAIGPGPAHAVRVRIDADRAEAARRAARRARVEERDDGGVDLVLEVRDVDALVGFVVGFLDGAEVIDPPEVRAAVVARVRSLAGEEPS